MSASCSTSAIKREHTGEIPLFHLHLHPLGNEYWPCLFDEIIDMLDSKFNTAQGPVAFLNTDSCFIQSVDALLLVG